MFQGSFPEFPSERIYIKMLCQLFQSCSQTDVLCETDSQWPCLLSSSVLFVFTSLEEIKFSLKAPGHFSSAAMNTSANVSNPTAEQGYH